MLERQVEVQGAYWVLCDRLSARPAAIREFFDLLLRTATVWSPESAVQARGAKKRLEAVNKAIAAQAEALAALLDEREDLHNHSAFFGNTQYHVVDLVEAASVENGHFQFHLRAKLQALRAQYDLKYWPLHGDFIRVLAEDADQVEVLATNAMTETSARASRASLADFFKALFVAIHENRGAARHKFPAEFDMTDGALAAFATVVLGLGPDDLLDASYVKRLRQREREA